MPSRGLYTRALLFIFAFLSAARMHAEESEIPPRLTLDAAIGLATGRNPTLAAAKYEIQAAEGDKSLQASGLILLSACNLKTTLLVLIRVLFLTSRKLPPELIMKSKGADAGACALSQRIKLWKHRNSRFRTRCA